MQHGTRLVITNLLQFGLRIVTRSNRHSLLSIYSWSYRQYRIVIRIVTKHNDQISATTWLWDQLTIYARLLAKKNSNRDRINQQSKDVKLQIKQHFLCRPAIITIQNFKDDHKPDQLTNIPKSPDRSPRLIKNGKLTYSLTSKDVRPTVTYSGWMHRMLF